MARTRSIIYIIRRYGLSSKRLSPKYPIKYEDAIKGLESYENNELKIVDVIDNVLFPFKSVSCHCQLPGCNHHIRYEYVLEHKDTHDRFVAGSTCVWPTLGMSELQKKEFLTYEGIVKEYHEMLQWKKDNPDVVEKIEKAKQANLSQFRPFWEEITHSALLDEDTEYIRETNIDQIITAREERDRKAREWCQLSLQQREEQKAEYQKVLTALDALVQANPENHFYASIKALSDRGIHLSDKQIRCIKIDTNKHWFESYIKPSASRMEVYNTCETYIMPIITQHYINDPLNMPSSIIKNLNSIIHEMDKKTQLAWSCYKVKHELVA